MRMFKRFGSILALAFAVCAAPFAVAADHFAVYAMVTVADSFNDGRAKLEADLAYQADAKVSHDVGVGAGLTRDGNGLRQFSAMELGLSSPEIIATA